MRTTRLRLRFLASLAASGAIVGASVSACGGAVEPTGTSSGSSGTSGRSGSTSGQSSSGYSSGGTSPTPPLPPSASPLPPSPPPTTCKYGTPTTECYTHDQLVAQLLSPPLGGDAADAGAADADISGSFDPNGCLPVNLVQNSCCNSAVTGPAWTGSTCCYVHCTGSCCGRPFVVDGEARVAGVEERDDWTGAGTPLAPPPRPERLATPARASGVHRAAAGPAEGVLDAETRALIAAAWARDAAMEHASVASFARFTLDLLALGAPAELVLGAQDAGRDEIAHATACFAIASRHAGKSLGPGKLDTSGVAPVTGLADAVHAAIVEGCIGETLSALLAEARLARAEDGETRATLRRIADEEACHAELAWRFVGWAIARGEDDLRETAARAFETALASLPQAWDASLGGIAPATLRAHGLLDEATAREVTQRALADVLAPCAAALATPPAAAA